MLVPVLFHCPVCGETIESAVDPSQGPSQRYVEDCQVCCRPLVLDVKMQGEFAHVTAVPESE
jgi:hypothetical protein